MIRIELSRSDRRSIDAVLREHVEAGADDGPFEIYFNGVRCLCGASLHHSALRYASDVGTPAFADWSPHPQYGQPGPRVQALLGARAERKAARLARRGQAGG